MKKKRVLVAMSGGVDSSVTALLLKKEGYEVIGVTLSLWEEKEALNSPQDYKRCCSLQAVNDAKKVAAKIGIPHYTLNFKEEFKKEVIDYFVEEYTRGRTPNPCLKCNQIIKFDLLLKKAFSLGADYLATGHYARIEYDEREKLYLLKKGRDKKKDQSYVLYMLNQKNLPHILLPLGSLTKEEVRKIAEKNGLHVATKKESQEICFIQEDEYGKFLQKYLHNHKGEGLIIDIKGNILGKHRGIIFYTVGQRRGLGIPHQKPLYVTSIDYKKNILVVGEEKALFKKNFRVEKANWVFWKKPPFQFEAKVKIRYRFKEAPAFIKVINEEVFEVEFHQPQKAITPGQAAVVYKEDKVLGGGIIEKVF